MNNKQQGFTLIEMMIVVAIIGILAAFAYPSYVEQVRKGKRSDAQVGLQQIAQRQEAFYVRNFAYAATLSALGYGADTIDSPEREYDLTLTTGAAQAYTAQATPKAASGQNSDNRCASFSLDQLGRKSALDSASQDATANCWR